MQKYALFQVLMLASGILFLGSAGHLIAHARDVAALFGRRRAAVREGDAGDLIADERGRRKGASRGTMIASLVIHLVGLAGLVTTGYLFTQDVVVSTPGAVTNPETLPIPVTTVADPTGQTGDADAPAADRPVTRDATRVPVARPQSAAGDAANPASDTPVSSTP